jgi:FixJ family two-component response regulator
MTVTPFAERASTGATSEAIIFIVNSDEPTRAWIEATVISAGLRAISVNTAAELLSRFTPGTAACVILDVTLPDASGFELQDELARAGASIMFLTRECCISSCVRAVKAGAVDFLTVPCDPTQLVRVLRHAVREAHSSMARCVQLGELRSMYRRLTAREREVFALVASGLLNKQIAQRLSISEVTVQIHRGRVMRKMSARSLASLVRMADALAPAEFDR